MLYRAVVVIKFRSCGLSCGTKLAARRIRSGSIITSAARANGTVSVGIELAQLSSYAL